MMALAQRKRRRPDMRRAVILFPSGLTLGNLFFGVFAIIAASRLEFVAAGVYVLLGGICDALDGRVARATNAGTEFGEELDSLVDAITFGLAPGMIMYFAVLNRSGWDWVWVFLFTACAVLRLARFNIEQAGSAKMYFQGLPSPAAGITLASYYWFSQSSLYTYGAIADLKWHVLLRYLMVVLSFLMISNVPYPVFPRTGFRSLRAIGATLLVIGSLVLLATRRLEYFFPFALIYVAWGLLRWVLSGLFERRQPTIPYDLSEGEDDDEDEDDDEFGMDSQVHATRRSHRAERARADRPERAERTDREARPERSERAERAEKSQHGRGTPDRSAPRAAATDRTSERAERGDRTERTDRAESRRTRETERPKREGRQKERPRRERPAREPQAEGTSDVVALDQPVVTGVDAITLGAPAAPLDSTMNGSPAATSDNAQAEATGAIPVEGTTAPRKRKRRRRRGERKDRSAAGEAVNDSDASSEAGDDNDGDFGADHDGDAGHRDELGSERTAAPTVVPAAEPPRTVAETPPPLPRSSTTEPTE